MRLPIPAPAPGELRVKIRTIGVNMPEVLSRRGVYGWKSKLSYVPGMEAFGEIDAVGEGVETARAGESVVVGTKFGAYAEYLRVPARQALVPPRGYSDVEAAGFLVNYLTAWVGLMEMARLRPTDRVLVTSAAGGVGSAVVQIATAHGARVVGMAGSGKQPTVVSLGADAAIDYRKTGWRAELKDAAGRRGFDVTFMSTGNAYGAKLICKKAGPAAVALCFRGQCRTIGYFKPSRKCGIRSTNKLRSCFERCVPPPVEQE